MYELRELLERFPSEKNPTSITFQWVSKLAYLCDVVSLLYVLNLSLQERMTIVFKLADKVAAFSL